MINPFLSNDRSSDDNNSEEDQQQGRQSVAITNPLFRKDKTGQKSDEEDIQMCSEESIDNDNKSIKDSDFK